MITIRRSNSFWLCTTAKEAFELKNVQLRLQGEMKDFDKFKQRLEKWEQLDVGVILVYKCSEAVKCSECPKFVGCEILINVKETAQAHQDFAKWVEANGGYMF